MKLPFMSVRMLVVTVLFFLLSLSAAHAFESEVGAGTRCTVCGMFVAKYPGWISKIILKDGQSLYFDGVKDMLVYYFSPEKYGQAQGNPTATLLVKDYYSLAEIEAKKAFFVVGSDVYGPMGHEFIPFSSNEAAEVFRQDHHGKEIVTFNAITSERVESMRAGQRMQ